MAGAAILRTTNDATMDLSSALDVFIGYEIWQVAVHVDANIQVQAGVVEKVLNSHVTRLNE